LDFGTQITLRLKYRMQYGVLQRGGRKDDPTIIRHLQDLAALSKWLFGPG